MRKKGTDLLFLPFVLIVLLIPAGPAAAEVREPTRYGLALSYVDVYHNEPGMAFILLTGFASFDYGQLWHNQAPASLRFKAELTAGAMTNPVTRLAVSGNIMAQRYLDAWACPAGRPYIEGGIGLIYTDWQAEGQGLRINFNPQAGFGWEFGPAWGKNWFAALRLHHYSNGDLNHDNHGVSSLLFQVGRYF